MEEPITFYQEEEKEFYNEYYYGPDIEEWNIINRIMDGIK